MTNDLWNIHPQKHITSRPNFRERFRDTDAILYAITDRKLIQKNAKDMPDSIRQAILGGATMIQLREKNITTAEYIAIAAKTLEICQYYDVPLIINDNVEVCLAVKAAGVHLGQDDESIIKAREILGPDYIIGATAHNLQEAELAYQQGADYLGVGAAFGSDTKKDAKPITSFETYRDITSHVPIPVVAIGGITADNLHQLAGLGLSGIAVISSIFGADDIQESTKHIKEKAKEELSK